MGLGKRRRMTILPGPDCTTMTDVRAGVDALDRDLVALIAKRFAYMDVPALGLDARGGVHIGKAPGQQRNQLAIERVDARADLGHGGAVGSG